LSINGLYGFVVVAGLVVSVMVDELVAEVVVVRKNVFPFVSIPVKGGLAVELERPTVLNKEAVVD